MNLLYLPHDIIDDILDFIGNNFYLFSTVSKAYLSLYKNKFKNTKTKLYSNLNMTTLKYAVKNKFVFKEKENFFSYDTTYYSPDGYKPGRPYDRYGYNTIRIIKKDTICDIAARQENFECLEYGLRQGIKFNTYKNPNEKVRKFIIKCIEVYGKKIDYYSVQKLVDGSYNAINAIVNNNLHDFKSIIDNGYLLNSNVAAQAAAGGKIEFLKYLRSNKCLIRDDALDYAKIYCTMCNNPRPLNTLRMNYDYMDFDLEKAEESLRFVQEYLRDTKKKNIGKKNEGERYNNYKKMGFKYPC